MIQGQMSKEEFQKWFNANYFAWASSTSRPLTSWLVSVEEFSEKEYWRKRREENLDAEVAGL